MTGVQTCALPIFYKNPATGRRAVIPFHGSRDLNVNVLRSILRQADLAEDEFVKLL